MIALTATVQTLTTVARTRAHVSNGSSNDIVYFCPVFSIPPFSLSLAAAALCLLLLLLGKGSSVDNARGSLFQLFHYRLSCTYPSPHSSVPVSKAFSCRLSFDSPTRGPSPEDKRRSTLFLIDRFPFLFWLHCSRQSKIQSHFYSPRQITMNRFFSSFKISSWRAVIAWSLATLVGPFIQGIVYQMGYHFCRIKVLKL